MSMPLINEAAPAFTANTTHGPRSLADYKGKWLILFSHPADFTPVCTTEFIAFAKAADQFKSMNCELLGLSIDSLFSHLAWVRNIKEKFGVDICFQNPRSAQHLHCPLTEVSQGNVVCVRRGIHNVFERNRTRCAVCACHIIKERFSSTPSIEKQVHRGSSV